MVSLSTCVGVLSDFDFGKRDSYVFSPFMQGLETYYTFRWEAGQVYTGGNRPQNTLLRFSLAMPSIAYMYLHAYAAGIFFSYGSFQVSSTTFFT